MTARPDVPDTPDRADAIARVLHRAEDPDCQKVDAHLVGYEHLTAALLATDDPAAVAAIAAQWAEHHPDTLLDALTKAGVLQGEMQLDPFGSARAIRREVTRWREVTR